MLLTTNSLLQGIAGMPDSNQISSAIDMSDDDVSDDIVNQKQENQEVDALHDIIT